jgi:FtsZ-binding cell division protein ZapB
VEDIINTTKIREYISIEYPNVDDLELKDYYAYCTIELLCAEVDKLREDKKDLITALESAMDVIEEHPIRRAHATELEFSRKLCNNYYELKRKKWDYT